ncbi:hypothetical protein MKJ01_04230 [Chryseobacterium sp. SSA4.19]|uniref:hypothetical protein n=1 Tax=Chryseobacterium sp. SSA4.19 TaxID=2919915 RepID=UPI001F4D77CB|nr:hypothetical protein [Chryseobacterium sp. SSA4.19]MCJ8152971.1 hypothetical protein [Chryseobacterium sp. SSA4.19]
MLIQNGKLLTALIFSCFYAAQNVTIDNKSGYHTVVTYDHKKMEIGNNQNRTVIDKNGIQNISILYGNDKKAERNISLFLNPQESLTIYLVKDAIAFKGEKEHLHDYVYRGFGYDLTPKITEYQKYYQSSDAKGFIRTYELYLADVLKKVERLNSSPYGIEDIHYKEVEKIARKRWFFTVFVSFNGGSQLNNTGKELLLYYFEKYFKKNIATYSCDSWDQYDIIYKYSQHIKLLNLKLPKYEIVEHTDDDEINQYLPEKCQEQHFRSSYNFLVYKKDLVRAEKYKKILTEKFHAKL